MATPLVKINGTTLTYQPSKILIKNPEGSIDQMEEGNWQGSSNTRGFEVTIEWGPGRALDGVITELRTRRGGLDECTLEFGDPNSVPYGPFNMLWLQDPDFALILAWSFDMISVTFRDRG